MLPQRLPRRAQLNGYTDGQQFEDADGTEGVPSRGGRTRLVRLDHSSQSTGIQNRTCLAAGEMMNEERFVSSQLGCPGMAISWLAIRS
jgi:hypothetical protein